MVGQRPRSQRRWARLGVLLAAGLAVLGAAIWLSGVGRDEPGRTVRVGLYENEPKVYTGSDGHPAGLFVEILAEVAHREGWDIQYVPCQWADCLEMVADGRLDLMPDVAYSTERDQTMDFHRLSVANSWSQVYSGPDTRVSGLSDLAGKRVALLSGGIQQQFLTDLMATSGFDFSPVEVSSLSEGYQAVADGRADAVVTNSFFAARNAAKYKLKETPIVFLPSTLYFAAGQDRHPELLAAIDANLARMRANPDSTYFDALHNALAEAPEVRTPHWVQWSLLGLAGVIALVALMALLLRSQVRARTQDLNATTQALAQERAHLEVLVEQRTAELAAAKDEAERLTHVKSDFLANMSHEIRTPMNAILGMLYLAEREDLPPEVRNHLDKARTAASSLLGIINDILDISKIEAGKLDLERTEFGLDGVLERVADAIAYQVAGKDVEFLIRYDPAIPPILVGDPLRLGQLMLNLCGNAVKFTEHGQVELALSKLHATPTDLTIQVMVRDSGIGMSAAEQAGMFAKFTQADASTTRRFGGTGLGLAISQSLAELMGGRIWLEDSQPGRGTTIGFTVRLGIAPSSQAMGQGLLDRAGPLLAGLRVLVVDDNEVSREILAEMLRYFRVEVGAVASGPAALDALRSVRRPYDLVLLDWRMPGMNGDEVTQRIHNDATIAPRPKVVLVTAYGREDVIRASELAGVDGILIKPVAPSTLLDAILTTLGRERVLGTVPGTGPTSGQQHRLAGARVLLVEDNAINREFAGELLRGQGMEVDEARDGQEAVERVRRGGYDAVLMDIQMPNMDGLAATRAIRAAANEPGGEHLAGLPVIAMTALAMAQDAQRSREAGMDDHVTKPIDPESLFATLARWAPAQSRGGAPAGPSRDAAHPAHPAARVPAGLLGLHSIDAASGVARIGGDEQAYRRQLMRFAQRYSGAVGQMRELAAERGAAAAEEQCHTLKGVAGTLSAQQLYQQLCAIDRQLRQGVIPTSAEFDVAQANLDDLLADVATIDPEAAPEPARSALPDTQFQELLARLDAALLDDLGAAEPLLDKLRIGVPADAAAVDILAQVADRLEVFDIDGARGLLAGLRSSVGPDRPAAATAGAGNE